MLLILNGTTPVIYGISVGIFYNQYYVYGESPTTGLTVTRIIFCYAPRICAIISGVYLMMGVVSIRRFFQKVDA